MSSAKLFFCARTGMDEPGAWAEMWTENKLRDFFRTHTSGSEILKQINKALKASGEKLQTLRVEILHGPDEDGRLYMWGEKQPGFQANDYSDHDGLKVEVNGKVVFNSLKPAGDEDEIEEHDPDCEDCAG